MLHPVMRGKAAEALFRAKCLLHDLEFYLPSTEEGRVDLLVGPHYYRCQVKLLRVRGYDRTRFLDLKKRVGPAGSGVWFRYGVSEVDFMVGVCAETYATYIVPIASTTPWESGISEQALARMGSRDAFHLLHSPRGEATLPMAPKLMTGHRPRDRWTQDSLREAQLSLLASDLL